MKLRVLGSSSRGNCYLLQSETTGEVLVLEAGISMCQVKKVLNFNICRIVGCLVSHEHGDHAKYVRDYLNNCINVFTADKTAEKLGINGHTYCYDMVIAGQEYIFKSFKVIPFHVRHDAVAPLGFLIYHPECGTVLFATDTYYLPNTFTGLTNILLECNYRLDILDQNIAEGIIHPTVRNRIVKSHMSYHTCCETLQANNLSNVNNIILIHLSDDNSHADEFRAGIAALTEKNVTIASAGLVMDFNKTPY